MASDIGLAQNLLPLHLNARGPDAHALDRAKNGKASHDVIRDTAEQFEAFFLQTVLDDLGKGIRSDFLGSGGHAEEIWRSMLNEEFAKTIASSGGVGIADTVYKELVALQEERNAPTDDKAVTSAGTDESNP